MRTRDVARRAATVLVVGAGVVFIALTIRSNWAEIGHHEWRARWGQLAVSVSLLLASLVWSVFVWKRVLDRFAGSGTPFRQLLRISFLSKIARYIPGKVWQFVAVGQLSRGSGSSASVLVSSMVVHAGFNLVTAVVASAVLVADRVDLLAARPALAAVAVAGIGLAATHPRVINLGLLVISKVARQDTLRWRGGWLDSLEVFLGALLSWAVDGVAFYLFVDALIEVQPQYLLPLIGIHASSFVAGYIAFVAPAGAGVREATMATLLRGLLSPGAAAVVAILARLWTIAAELVGALLVLALTRPRAADGAVVPADRPAVPPTQRSDDSDRSP